MKKKLFLFFSLLVVFTAVLNAQSTQRHWLSASPGLRFGGSSWVWVAAELRYEYMLSRFFSAGAYAYYEDSFGIGIAGRWYPFAKSFFLELSSGYNMLYRSNLHLDYDTDEWLKDPQIYSGIDIIPGFGWRIDVGKPGGLYITPSAKLPVILRWYKDPYLPAPHIIYVIIGYLGLGYAF